MTGVKTARWESPFRLGTPNALGSKAQRRQSGAIPAYFINVILVTCEKPALFSLAK